MIADNEYEQGYIHHEDGIDIYFAINKDPNLMYFKIYKSHFSKECIAISMLEPKYLYCDFKLTIEEIAKLTNILQKPSSVNKSYTVWDMIIYGIDDYRLDELKCGIISNYKTHENLSIPDYTKLK